MKRLLALLCSLALNQFSMDEYNGYFRIVTTENVTHYFNGGGIASAEQEKTRNHLFVLDESMNIVGSIEDLARGESMSVSFPGGIYDIDATSTDIC